MPTDNDDRLMTLREVAAFTRVPTSTLYTWRSQGSGGPKTFKAGRAVVAWRSDVIAWLNEQMQREEAS